MAKSTSVNKTVVVTRCPTITYNYEWTVHDLLKFPDEHSFISPDFHPSPECTWYIELNKLCDRSIFFEIFSRQTSKLKISFNISISDHKQMVLYTISEERTCAYSDKVKLITNISYKLSTTSLHDTLIFKCCMVIDGAKPTSTVYNENSTISKSTELASSLRNLCNDFKTLFESSEHADVCLYAEGESVRAHKSILCARSHVLRKMFDVSMKERVTNVINITDIPLSVLKSLVAFLYSGDVAIGDFDAACTLYYAAEKYEVLDLRRICGDDLLNRLTPNNACELYAIADRHRDEHLISILKDYICVHFREIVKSDKWKSFVKTETGIAAEIVTFCSERKA